jgi:hypothetical protein
LVIRAVRDPEHSAALEAEKRRLVRRGHHRCDRFLSTTLTATSTITGFRSPCQHPPPDPLAAARWW